MKFRPDIEGLRAVAIVPVVLYHAGSSLVPGGFIGVDVFFVISGFLISRIIFEEVAAGRFSHVQFYRRRVRRIFPALFFMLAVVTLTATAILPPVELQEFAKTLIGAVLFVANLTFIHLNGYFAPSAALKPLLHTWSLAVEEQFYILFPIVLIAIKRWCRGRFVLALAIAAVLSFAINLILLGYGDTRGAFFHGPARAFELLTGALLALGALPPLASRFWREAVGIAGAVMILVASLAFADTMNFPGIYALLPCLGTAAIIHAGNLTAISKVLSNSAVRFVGAISYSLYLWHWPLLVLTRWYFMGEQPVWAVPAAVIASFGLAALSWYVVERPFRLPEHRDKPIFAKGAWCMAGAIAASILILVSHGIPWRFPDESLRLFAAAADHSPSRQECPVERTSLKHACVLGPSSAKHFVAVWSDSHGFELAYALGEAGIRTLQIANSACPPVADFSGRNRSGCLARNESAWNALRGDAQISTVILAARYHWYSSHLSFWSGLETTMKRLRQAGKKIIVVYPYPQFPHSVPNALGVRSARGMAPVTYAISRTVYDAENADTIRRLDALTLKYGAGTIRTDRLLCNAARCPAVIDGEILYFDDNHLSLSGARRLVREVVRMLEEPSKPGRPDPAWTANRAAG